MDYLFIYIFILLTGKSEVCRVFKQVLENHQVAENRPQWRGKKILVCHSVWSARPLRIPCPGVD